MRFSDSAPGTQVTFWAGTTSGRIVFGEDVRGLLLQRNSQIARNAVTDLDRFGFAHSVLFHADVVFSRRQVQLRRGSLPRQPIVNINGGTVGRRAEHQCSGLSAQIDQWQFDGAVGNSELA